MFTQLTPELIAANATAYLAVHADTSPWTLENLLRDAPSKWVLSFAMHRNGAPVSYCILSARNGATHINQLMVSRDKRRCGIGGLMLVEAVRRGASSLKVDPANNGARKFYERHGWRESGSENGYCVYTYDQTATQSAELPPDPVADTVIAPATADDATVPL